MAEPVTEGNIEIRKKAFSRWLNHHFQERPNMKIKIKEDELIKSFSDGIYLSNLLEIVSKRILFRWNPKPKNRSEKIKNLEQCLSFLECPPIVSAESVVDGNETAVLSLIWVLIQSYHLKLPGEEFKMAKIRFREKLQERGIEVTNFTSDFKNHPDRFSRLVNLLQPGIILERQLKLKKPKKMISFAMNTAYTKLGIPKLLDITDIFAKHPDELANITYFGYFVQHESEPATIFNMVTPPKQLIRTNTSCRIQTPSDSLLSKQENSEHSEFSFRQSVFRSPLPVQAIPENVSTELRQKSTFEIPSLAPETSIPKTVSRVKSEGQTRIREKISVDQLGEFSCFQSESSNPIPNLEIMTSFNSMPCLEPGPSSQSLFSIPNLENQIPNQHSTPSLDYWSRQKSTTTFKRPKPLSSAPQSLETNSTLSRDSRSKVPRCSSRRITLPSHDGGQKKQKREKSFSSPNILAYDKPVPPCSNTKDMSRDPGISRVSGESRMSNESGESGVSGTGGSRESKESGGESGVTRLSRGSKQSSGTSRSLRRDSGKSRGSRSSKGGSRGSGGSGGSRTSKESGESGVSKVSKTSKSPETSTTTYVFQDTVTQYSQCQLEEKVQDLLAHLSPEELLEVLHEVGNVDINLLITALKNFKLKSCKIISSSDSNTQGSEPNIAEELMEPPKETDTPLFEEKPYADSSTHDSQFLPACVITATNLMARSHVIFSTSPILDSTNGMKVTDGPQSYDVEITGTEILKGKVHVIKPDGSLQVGFWPRKPGSYEVQLYLHSQPLLIPPWSCEIQEHDYSHDAERALSVVNMNQMSPTGAGEPVTRNTVKNKRSRRPEEQ